MVLFASITTGSAYEGLLRDCGVNPRSLPPNVNAEICGYIIDWWHHQARCAGVPKTKETLIATARNTGRFVVFCHAGLDVTRSCGIDVKQEEQRMKHAAEQWIKDGPELTIEGMVICSLARAKLLENGFIDFFNTHLIIKGSDDFLFNGLDW